METKLREVLIVMDNSWEFNLAKVNSVNSKLHYPMTDQWNDWYIYLPWETHNLLF